MARRASIRSNARKASKLLKSMCSEHRMLILCQLVPGEKTVSKLQKILGLRQAAVSQHLSRLRNDKLVKTYRIGKNIYYALASEEVSTVIETIYSLYCDTDATLTLKSESSDERVISLH
jgi:DNA-binding transcriptional ArsR family regulator